MTQEDMETWLVGVRERRSRLYKVARATLHHARNSGDHGLAATLEKKSERLHRAMEKVDAELNKAEKLINEVVALRLQSGVTVAEIQRELAA
jgi:hypothetical protein